MVFQHRKNRYGAKPKQRATGTKTTLTDLPNELLLHVLHHADVTEVLRLRETSRSFVPACTETIRDKLKVLYVHPSPSSVQRAITICESDWSTDIEEICFVSKDGWYSSLDFDVFGPSDYFAYTWPLVKSRHKEAPTNNLVHKDSLTFGESYNKLLSSLAGLRLSRTFSFQEVCDRPGFNMLSVQRIDGWLRIVRPGASSKERKAENKLYGARYKVTPQNNFRFADIDALAFVLAHPQIKFTRLKLDHELTWVDSVQSCPYPLIRDGCFRALTHLDLTISNASFLGRKMESFYKDLLSSVAATLRELKIAMRYRDLRSVFIFEVQTNEMGSIAKMLQHIYLPELRHLELCCLPVRGAGVIDMNAVTPYIAAILQFDLERVIENQCKKLEYLQLTNIMSCIGPDWPPRPRSMDDIILDLGSRAREVRGLEHKGTRAWELNIPEGE
jgi:hypothetical protein